MPRGAPPGQVRLKSLLPCSLLCVQPCRICPPRGISTTQARTPGWAGLGLAVQDAGLSGPEESAAFSDCPAWGAELRLCVCLPAPDSGATLRDRGALSPLGAGGAEGSEAGGHLRRDFFSDGVLGLAPGHCRGLPIGTGSEVWPGGLLEPTWWGTVQRTRGPLRSSGPASGHGVGRPSCMGSLGTPLADTAVHAGRGDAGGRALGWGRTVRVGLREAPQRALWV